MTELDPTPVQNNKPSQDGKSPKSVRTAYKSPLGRRLMLWVIIISAINAIVATSIQLTLDYRRDLTDLSNTLTYIEKNLVSGVAEAIYNYDNNQLRVQLEGIYGSPWISGALVFYGPEKSKNIHYGNVELTHRELRSLPLEVRVGSKSRQVGVLHIVPNMEMVYQRTWQRVSVVLLTQTVIIFIVSLSILVLFSALVTHHLERIANYTRTHSPTQDFEPLSLNRAIESKNYDELDDLVDSINNTWLKLKEANKREAEFLKSLEQMVVERTTELEAANKRLAELSATDPLTNLANRRKFDHQLDLELRRAKRTRRYIALAFIDVDNFKLYNDNYGHLAGDECLQKIAQILQKYTQRPCDLAARYGGEEFAIILGDLKIDDATQYAEMVRQAIEDLRLPHCKTSYGVVTVSIGVGVVFPDIHFDAEELIDMADQALYAAKDKGRNCVVLTSYSA